jgi:hypothetical protein
MLFDTHKLAKALERGGLEPDGAEAVVAALQEAHGQLVTQAGLETSETKIEKSIADALHKQTVYIIGLIIAAIGATAAIVHLVK